MPRNGASASSGAVRKQRGEEKNKAKWMNEAKRNKKRAEEAEEKLAQLQAKLSVSNGDNAFDAAIDTSAVVDSEAPVSVSRSEFDMLKAQLEAVKSAHSAALHEKQLAESSSNNERGVLQASLDFAQQESKKLMEELAVAKKAEQVARMLFEQTNKANLAKEKTIQQLSISSSSVNIGTPNVGVTTPAFDVILDSPAAAKNVSPITPERLDFRDDSPMNTPNAANTTTERGGLDLCASKIPSGALTAPKPLSILAKIQKWIANLFASIRALLTGRTTEETENTPLLHIAV